MTEETPQKTNTAESISSEETASSSSLVEDKVSKRPKSSSNLTWCLPPAFLLFWLVLFYAVVIPIYKRLPTANSIDFEHLHKGQFIAERAQRILYEFDEIGIKLTGTDGNENRTVQLILGEISKIQANMNDTLFDIEVDVQSASGSFYYNHYLRMYHGVQNIVVKFSDKRSTSDKYLLVNSHFDSKPGSPGTGDDGAMVVNMLEVLRVLASGSGSFQHPIIFLFNGAEELGLLASHGFVTQHKWAKNVATLINLDCSGSGHRELLFQHSNNHPWLMKYYKNLVKLPYANTLAEELFQSGFLPSDTDFAVFKRYGNYTGLDMAYTYNGYVYHTKYDTYDVISRESLQNTGNNLLALIRALANAPELANVEQYRGDLVVFFDANGMFLISYTYSQGFMAGALLAVLGLLLTFINLWNISNRTERTFKDITYIFLLVLIMHIIGIVLAIVLPILVSMLMVKIGHSMAWFTNVWFIIGLYICPAILGLLAPTTLLFYFKSFTKITQEMEISFVLYAHKVVMCALLIACLVMHIRSSFVIMIPLGLYLIADMLNMLLSNIALISRTSYWLITIFLGQIVSFVLLSGFMLTILIGVVPILGRIGSQTNSELILAVVAGFFSILLMGFLLPLLNFFRRAKTTFLFLILTTTVFVLLAALTLLGFPYRPRTSVQRVNFQAVHRVFHDYNGDISRNESGLYFFFQDSRRDQPLKPYVDLKGMDNLEEHCEKYLACGVPIYNYQWYNGRALSTWLPLEEKLILPEESKLEVISRVANESSSTVRYEFSFKGPLQMNAFIRPLSGVKILSWTFPRDFLENLQEEFYQLSLTCGNELVPLEFFIEVQSESGALDQPLFELGVSAHYVSEQYPRDPVLTKFINRFPEYTFVLAWPSSYDSFVF